MMRALAVDALALIPVAAASEVVRITVHDLVISPAEVEIKWVNSDFIDHTATAKDDSWDVAAAAGK
jgi:plastocyanin